MSDPAADLLLVTIGAIRADAGVAAEFEGRAVEVWETAPSRAPGAEGSQGYPFVEVPTIEANFEEFLDCDDSSEAFAHVHVYDRIAADGSGGKPRAMKIAARIGRLFAAEGGFEAIAGFRVVLAELTSTRHFTESDGLTAHSILLFRLLLEPLEV